MGRSGEVGGKLSEYVLINTRKRLVREGKGDSAECYREMKVKSQPLSSRAKKSLEALSRTI